MEILNPLSIARGNRLYEPAGSSGYLQTKAGRVLAASFAGNPKTAAVTFGAAMPSTNYGVTLTCLTTESGFPVRAESKTAGGFTINLGSDSTASLTEVAWVATMDGEST